MECKNKNHKCKICIYERNVNVKITACMFCFHNESENSKLYEKNQCFFERRNKK